MTVLTMKQRKDLRFELLNNLYVSYFASGGECSIITSEVNVGFENLSAYKVLHDLGKIKLELGHAVHGVYVCPTARITAKGMNEVESQYFCEIKKRQQSRRLRD